MYDTLRDTLTKAIRQHGFRPKSAFEKKRKRLAKAAWEKLLRSRTFMRPKATALKAAIENCKTQHPCGSGHCPRCMQEAQRLIERELRTLAKEAKNKALKLCAVTIISHQGAIEIGKLSTFDHQNYERRAKKLFADAPIEWAVFGVDYACCVGQANKPEPYWMVHLQGLVSIQDVEALKAFFKDEKDKPQGFLCKQHIGKRPTNLVEWDSRNRWLRYVYKLDFFRRFSIDAKRKSTGAMCKNTREKPLQSDERIELGTHLMKIGLDARLILVRCQMRKTAEGLHLITLGEDRKIDPYYNA